MPRQPGPPRTQLPVSKIYTYACINILQRKLVTIGVRSMRRKGGGGGGGGGGRGEGGGGRMPTSPAYPN